MAWSDSIVRVRHDDDDDVVVVSWLMHNVALM